MLTDGGPERPADGSTVAVDALQEAWERIRQGLRSDLGSRLFDQWLRQARLGPACDLSRTVEIWLPSDFSANFVASNFEDRLRLAWRSMKVGIDGVRVMRAPDGGRQAAVYRPSPTETVERVPMARDSTAFQPRHDFDSFVVGESNRLAFSAAEAIASADRPLFNPLYIHGGTGQGKTHLLHAIASAYGSAHAGGPIIYLSAERFMTEFVNAMRANAMMEFKARLRSAGLLLIDDIQFIAGKGSTQEELLHTLNELGDRGARIVIAADRAPQQLDGVDPRILSRLAGGLVADIRPADLELRLSILSARRSAVADARHLDEADLVPDEVVDFLARSIRSNIRELEGAFNKLIAYAQLSKRRIDLEFAQSMLADAVRANSRRITVDEIQKACAAHYRIEQSEMRSKRRARAVARPRQVAMYLAKKLTPRSLPEIGRIFGGRDHSTVIHAVRTIEALREANPDIDADVRAIQRQLEG